MDHRFRILQRPDHHHGDYRAVHWHGYRGWCMDPSSAAVLLASSRQPADLAGRGRTGFRGAPRNLVTRLPSDGQLVWVKWFRPRGPFSWLRYLGRPTKAEKAWRIAFALIDAGVDTPQHAAGGDGALPGPVPRRGISSPRPAWRHKKHRRTLPMVPRRQIHAAFAAAGCRVVVDRAVLPVIHAHRIALFEKR